MPACVGDSCVVLSPLHPTGLVTVGGERRPARALLGTLPQGAAAVVVGWDPFGLIVRPAAEVPDPARLPGRGEPCPAPKELVAEREADAEAVRAASHGVLGPDAGERLLFLLPVCVLIAAAGWWWAGVPGVAVGALLGVLVASLFLAWVLLN